MWIFYFDSENRMKKITEGKEIKKLLPDKDQIAGEAACCIDKHVVLVLSDHNTANITMETFNTMVSSSRMYDYMIIVEGTFDFLNQVHSLLNRKNRPKRFFWTKESSETEAFLQIIDQNDDYAKEKLRYQGDVPIDSWDYERVTIKNTDVPIDVIKKYLEYATKKAFYDAAQWHMQNDGAEIEKVKTRMIDVVKNHIKTINLPDPEALMCVIAKDDESYKWAVRGQVERYVKQEIDYQRESIKKALINILIEAENSISNLIEMLHKTEWGDITYIGESEIRRIKYDNNIKWGIIDRLFKSNYILLIEKRIDIIKQELNNTDELRKMANQYLGGIISAIAKEWDMDRVKNMLGDSYCTTVSVEQIQKYPSKYMYEAYTEKVYDKILDVMKSKVRNVIVTNMGNMVNNVEKCCINDINQKIQAVYVTRDYKKEFTNRDELMGIHNSWEEEFSSPHEVVGIDKQLVIIEIYNNKADGQK